MKKEGIIYSLLTLIGLGIIICLFFNSPIEQDNSYHLFCNESHIAGVSNFWNVISNLPFLFAGVYGLYTLRKQKINPLNYILFFTGVSLVSLGSGYYHLNPNNETLIWDRLPMTISFTAFISIVISEFINKNIGKKLLLPLLLLGITSILYWVITGDLSLYAFIQFYPIISIPIVLLTFKSNHQPKTGYWLLIFFYIIAKLLETFDHEIHHILGFVSGHPLKHLAAATGVFLFAFLRVRE